jgi:Icc-related predicted phosphoesterase
MMPATGLNLYLLHFSPIIANINGKKPYEMRTFIIGDIHGCFDELMELTEKVGLTDSDLLISLGDIVDRGNKAHIDNFTKRLLETHKETFNLEANKQTFKTYIFKSKSNNLTIQDLQKGLNTPNKILNIRQELGIN